MRYTFCFRLIGVDTLTQKLCEQTWCGNRKAYNKTLYPTPGVMPALSCSPEIMAFDVHDGIGVPAAAPFMTSYSNGQMFHGHFSCTID